MKFFDYINSINEFAKTKGIMVDPMPHVVLNRTTNDKFNPFISTGNFQYESNTIELYIDNRLLKDILRSYCHELVHADLFHSDPDMFIVLNKSGTIAENSALAEYEGDAYLRGNLLFRQWTELFTHS